MHLYRDGNNQAVSHKNLHHWQQEFLNATRQMKYHAVISLKCLGPYKEFQLKVLICGSVASADLGNLLTQPLLGNCKLFVATDYFCIICLSSHYFGVPIAGILLLN